jgi:glucosamine--fructose-6-phosphate aminotransferase (isomerizing)
MHHMWKIPATPLTLPNSIVDDEARKSIEQFYRQETEREWNPPATDAPLCPKRMNRVIHTIDEINTQADKIEETLREEREAIREAARHLSRRAITRVYMTGCGDSVAALEGVRFLLEEVLAVPCEAIQALDLAYYYNKCVNDKSLVVMLSSSGATLRTLEAMYVARARGAQTLTLSNTPGSMLMEKSSRGLIIHATRKGWPTQASTAAMALVMQLGLDLARERKSCPAERIDELQREFNRVPGLVRTITENCREQVKTLAGEWARKTCYLFVAGGPSFSSAFFGSAKIKEATPDHALHIPMEEFHHYNSVKEGEPMFVIAPSGLSVPRARDTLIEGRRFGGLSCAVTTVGEDELVSLADHAILLPPVMEYFSGLTSSPPVQMFGYHVAMEKFDIASKEQA